MIFDPKALPFWKKDKTKEKKKDTLTYRIPEHMISKRKNALEIIHHPGFDSNGNRWVSAPND
jgi:hypothetical protein